MQAQMFSNVLSRVQSLLLPLGYKKKHATFTLRCDDVLLIINLQKSHKSTKDEALVTVNLGVYSLNLASKLGELSSSPNIWDCHWQERLGFLMPVRDDKWWKLSNENEATSNQVADEIMTGLEKYGLPALESVASTDKLITSWEQGSSPGLTDVQVSRYLNLLK